MLHWAACGAALTTAAMISMSGCASQCTANPDKLAALQRGMSYGEASRTMGCPGRTVSSGEISSVEWDGPGPNLFMATQLDFLDDKLLYYTTRSRSGF